jgi:predicted nucleic acid-binding protein
MAQKPTAYIDTNVLSSLFYRGANLQSVSRRMHTEEWWEAERKHFDVYSSVRTEYELSRGVFRAQERALAEVRKLRYLPLTAAARKIALQLLESKVVPPTQMGDGQHLGIAIAHEMDYLITWNYAHLANHAVEMKLRELAAQLNWRVPVLASPENIPWVSMGKTVRRRD